MLYLNFLFRWSFCIWLVPYPRNSTKLLNVPYILNQNLSYRLMRDSMKTRELCIVFRTREVHSATYGAESRVPTYLRGHYNAACHDLRILPVK
jgi:hypothetical protein